MKNLLILLLIFLVGCQEEDFEMIAAPNFTTPEVVVINENGATFKATILTTGKEQIIEYGFVWDISKSPSIENSSSITVKGEPMREFALEAVKGLLKGRQYFVATVLKTASSTYYSESVSFISQGSKEFIFEKINSKPSIYFGDTLEILGANLEENSQFLLKVKFEDKEVPVFDVSAKGFKISVPREFRFEPRIFEENDIRITVEIADQLITIPNSLKFEKPQFDLKRKIDYGLEWEIQGKYLFTTPRAVEYQFEDEIFYFPLEYIEDERYVFKPTILFKERNPVFRVVIRTKEYETNQIEINETDLISGQVFGLKSFNERIEIKAKNINPLSNEDDIVLNNNPSIGTSSTPISNEAFDFSIGVVGPISTRFMQFHITNFGQPSTNFFTVNYLNPVIPVSGLPSVVNFSDEFRVASLGTDSYLVGGGRILSVDMNSQTVREIRDIPQAFSGLEGFVTAYKNKLYLTNFSAFPNGNLRRFFEFDPQTNSIKELADFPQAGILIGKFVAENKLYVDLNNFENGTIKQVRFSYDFNKNIWSEVSSEQFFVNKYADFEYAGNLYVFGIGPDATASLQFGLFIWDESRNQFKIEKPLPLIDFPYEEFSVAVKGNFAYYQLKDQTIQFDLLAKRVSKRSTLIPLEASTMGISNGKLYVLGKINRHLVCRIDPEYFD